MLIRRPGQGADLAELAAQFDPGVAGVFAREYFAIVTAGENPVGVRRGGRARPYRRVGFKGQRQRLPALSAILGALDRAGAAERTVAGGDKHHSGLVGLERQAAAIGQAKMLADPQTSPALAAIRAGKDLARGTGQHCLGAIYADRRVVDVGVVDPGDPRPAFSAVTAATYAVDFHPGPYHPVVRGIDRQRRHSRNADIRALLRHIGPELVPMASTVGRSKERRWPSSCEDGLGVRRIESDFPHVHSVHRRVEPLEVLPAVLAAVDAVICSGQHGPRLLRVYCEAEHAAFGPQSGSHLSPAFTAVGAHPGAGPYG